MTACYTAPVEVLAAVGAAGFILGAVFALTLVTLVKGGGE